MTPRHGPRAMPLPNPAALARLAAGFVAAVVVIIGLAGWLGWAAVLVAAAALVGGVAIGSGPALVEVLKGIRVGGGGCGAAGDTAAAARAGTDTDPAATAGAGRTRARQTDTDADADTDTDTDTDTDADTDAGGGGAAGAAGGPAGAAGGPYAEVDRRPAIPAGQPGERVLEAAALLAEQVGAERLVLWRREQGRGGRLEPWLSTGAPPPGLSPEGEVLVWCLEEEQPLRIEEPPIWAGGPVAALPFRILGERVVLTVEATGPGRRGLPDDVALRRVAGILGIVLEGGRDAAEATAAQARFGRMVEFIRDLPRDRDRDAFPERLASAALEVAGGSGAAVASWREETGQVLARVGEGGGPAPGTWFGIMDGDFAITARARDIIHRDHRRGRALPLAGRGERWTHRPRFTAIVPLRDGAGETGGLVAVWGEREMAADGLFLVAALGPVLAFELHRATDLARWQQRATEDPLTGLANRSALEDRLDLERKRFHRYRHPLAALVLDIDHFKRVNDTHGHLAGDAILTRLGDVLRRTTRETDFVARFGGEEIVILMTETMRREAEEAAERVRTAVEHTAFEWNGTTIPITVSIGASACPECVDDPAALLQSADRALYASKEGGRNRVTVAPTTASDP